MERWPWDGFRECRICKGQNEVVLEVGVVLAWQAAVVRQIDNAEGVIDGYMDSAAGVRPRQIKVRLPDITRALLCRSVSELCS